MERIVPETTVMEPDGFARAGVFGACAAGHHATNRRKGCPGFVLDFKCTCECHDSAEAVERKPAITGWCATGHHEGPDGCPILRKNGAYVCSCACHRKTEKRPAPDVLAAEPQAPRLVLKKRRSKS